MGRATKKTKKRTRKRQVPEFDVGVLFVHGIGAQGRGQTLIEFGEPIFRWIEDRYAEVARDAGEANADAIKKALEELEHSEWSGSEPTTGPRTSAGTLVARVRSSETRLHDAREPDAPAHTKLILRRRQEDGNTSGENWLFAESWWAEQFAPPSYGDLVKWSCSILPWVLGSHFAAQIRRRWDERPWNQAVERSRYQADRHPREGRGPFLSFLSGPAWSARILAAWGRLGVGLLLSVVTVPLLVLFLVVAILPIPQVRSVLLRVQRGLASILGDSYVFLDRPIESASIVRQVRYDLAWLSRRCKAVAIVAHSQGGAVAHQALRGKVPKNLRLLFTFGSGLRKLEQLREVMQTGAPLRLSAIITSLATFLFAFFLIIVMSALLDGGPDEGLWGGVGLLVVCLAFVLAGVLDYLRGIELPHLERWLAWLKERDFEWVDCYASADPVPNGRVSPSAINESREVHNRGSVISDHTSYWENRDEFISLLVGELSKAFKDDKSDDSELDFLALPDELFEKARNRYRYVFVVGCF